MSSAVEGQWSGAAGGLLRRGPVAVAGHGRPGSQ